MFSIIDANQKILYTSVAKLYWATCIALANFHTIIKLAHISGLESYCFILRQNLAAKDHQPRSVA